MSFRGMCLLAVLLSLAAGAVADPVPLFDPPVVYNFPGEAKTAAIGDLNGDGLDDVAVTAWPSSLYVLYQQPDKTLGPPVQLYSPIMPLALAVGDLNQDSRLDLVVGGSNGSVLLYYQQSDGTFGLPDAGWGYGQVNSLVIDDFNGDGLNDIADTSATFASVLVSLQAPGGTFGLPASYALNGFNSRSICALDYNSDGIRDLACLVDDSICYLAGIGDGTFAEPLYLPATWGYALAAGDVTGDGKDDLVFTVPDSTGYGTVTVFPQGADGQPASPQFYPAYDYAQALALADLDGDGRKDVAAVHSGWEALTVTRQNADGTLGQWSPYTIPYGNDYQCGALAVGDLNADGNPDIAVADPWNGLIVLPHTAATVGPLPDTTAPVCTASVSGTTGLNGWYVSDVTVTLSAEDAAEGSGLGSILVTLDGATWSAYSAPLVVSDQGTTSIGYCAEDGAGNRAQAQWVSVKIDKGAPVLTVKPSLENLWPPNGAVVNVPVSVAASDTISGVARMHLSLQDEYGLIQPEMEVASGSVVNVPLVAYRDDGDKDGRVYTIIVTSADQAGNVAVAASAVTVPGSAPKKPKKPVKDK